VTCSISGVVWDDADWDGIRDGGESGLSNRQVKLFDATDTQVGVAQTIGANGAYSFTGLDCDPWATYQVEFKLQGSNAFSPANQGSVEAEDSDAERVIPGNKRRTADITLTVGTDEDERADAGMYDGATIKIGDYVWEDTDCDGVQDGSESGLHSVLLTLYRDGNTTPLESAISDSGGWYEFEIAKDSGDYYVVAELRSGYVFSPGNQEHLGSVATDSDIESYFVDSSGNVDTTRGRSWVADSASNHLYAADVGLCPVSDTINIGDYVWEDTDCDGFQDSSESGIEDVTISLYRKDDNEEPYFTTESGTNGLYTFEVPKDTGNYHVVATLPAGYIFSPGDIHDADDDSDIVAYFIDSSGNVDYSRGRANNGNAERTNDSLNRGDVGLCPDTNKGTIGDYVWEDTDEDGIQDGSESGIADVRVRLYCVDEGEECFETETDANGAYHFDVWPGREYRVRFDMPSPANDYDFSPVVGNQSDGDNSDVEDDNYSWGETDDIDVGASGGDYTDYADAGIFDD
jgi:hypothetical protein